MASMETVRGLVEQGFVVIPVHAVGPDGTCKCPRGRNCTAPGKHPIGDGWEQQTQDEGMEAFERLEAKGWAYNVGILVGPSGLLVVDVDPRNGGNETMRDFFAKHGKFEPSRVVYTGGGGSHYYARRPEGLRFKGSLGPGVDLKTSGMVVAEGSASSTGTYSLKDDTPIAPTPESVIKVAVKVDEPVEVKTSTSRKPVDPNDPDLPRRQNWCRSGVQAELERLEAMERAKVPDYGRNEGAYQGEHWNQTVYNVSCNLFEFANTPEAGMDYEEVVDLVLAKAPRDAGFTEETIKQTIASARDHIGLKAKAIPEPRVDPFASAGAGVGSSTGGDVFSIEPIDRMVGRLWKDSHVAEAFAEHHARELRYINGLGWFRWSDIEGRWVDVDTGIVSGMSDTFAKELLDGAGRRNDAVAAKGAAGRLNRGPIEAVTSLAANNVALREELTSLDGDPELLNCTNGYVNLRTGELHPHNPDKMMTKTTGVAYRPGAKHPDVEMALECLDEEEREWIQMMFGQALTGYLPPEDYLTFLHGVGANGKTALVGTLRRVVGSYGVTMSERVIMASSQAHTTDMTDLLGARMAVLEELPEGGNLSEERIKKIVGSETMKARKMRQDNIEWEPTHTVFVTTNHRPKVAGTDTGIWRRLVMLTFPYRYVRDESKVEGDRDRVGDVGLRHRLSLEPQREAFLAWVIEGAVKYIQQGAERPFDLTKRMQEDVDDWRSASDPLGRFVDEMLEFDPNACVVSSDFFDEFKQWLTTNGHPAWSSQLVTARLENHHVAVAHNVKRTRVRMGPDCGLSPRPGPVQVQHRDGQQMRVWQGMKWREDLA